MQQSQYDLPILADPRGGGRRDGGGAGHATAEEWVSTALWPQFCSHSL